MRRFLPLPPQLAITPELAVLDLLDVTLEATAAALFAEHPHLHDAHRTPWNGDHRSQEYAAQTIVLFADRLRAVLADYRRLVDEDGERVHPADYPF